MENTQFLSFIDPKLPVANYCMQRFPASKRQRIHPVPCQHAIWV